MKRNKHLSLFDAFKSTLVVVLIASIALVALPIGALGRNRAQSTAFAETESTVTKSSVKITVNFFSREYVVGGYPFNMWIWADGSDGERFDFNAETVEIRDKQWKTLTATIENVPIDSANPTATAIGVIYKHGTSANADWGWQTNNLLIPANKIVDNKVTIYLVDGEEVVYYEEDVEDIDLSIKFSTVKFSYLSSKYAVTVNAGTAKFTEDTVLKIIDSSGGEHGTIVCSEVPENGTVNYVGKSSVSIPFEGEFSFGETYTLVDESPDDDTRFKSCEISKVALYDKDEIFGDLYNYDGDDLGVTFEQDKITYKLWAPASSEVKLNIYASGNGGDAEEVIPMTAGEKGVYTAETSLEMSGKYYTYSIVNGSTTSEIVDPYARSAGRDGVRGMILDLSTTNPEGWEDHSRPAARGSYNNAIIYEAHIRDLTIHESSNVSEANRGKFLGMTETASDANGNKMTPLDYIKELGVTELHIQPMFDFSSVSEDFNVATYDAEAQFNWGYDPLNYNVPEGSYSSDPADGAARVRELKEMIMALHEAGIRVIMDVVYNHVSSAPNSNFEKILPGYFFRTDSAGAFTSYSGCGNDTASERYMYHKFMVESVNYWADEYKIDGFRFDLMGLHDTLTMNEIYDTLAAKNPDIMVYGEGWVMGNMTETADRKKADMTNAAYMPNIAFFNDVTRDTLKGGGYGTVITARGYAEGATRKDPAVYIGAVGGTNISDAGYRVISKSPFAANPTQNIAYVSCHDNDTLWDKINACSLEEALEAKKAMNRLAAASVFTSQGAVFMLAGEELLRSKPTTEENDYNNDPQKWLKEDYYFSYNSYMSPDSVNAIDWSLAETNADMVEFYKQLIVLRKNSPQFHISTTAELEECVIICDNDMTDGIAYYAVKDPNSDEYAVLLFNNTANESEVLVPNGDYSVYVNGDQANGTTPIATFSGNKYTVGARSAVIMKANLTETVIDEWIEASAAKDETPEQGGDGNASSSPKKGGNLGLALGLGIGIPVAVLVAGGAVFGVMYSKKKGKKSNAADSDKTEDKPQENAEEKASEDVGAEEKPVDEKAPEEGSVEDKPEQADSSDDK